MIAVAAVSTVTVAAEEEGEADAEAEADGEDGLPDTPETETVRSGARGRVWLTGVGS